MAKAKAKRTQRHGSIYGARALRASRNRADTRHRATAVVRQDRPLAGRDNAIGSVKGAIDGLVDAGVLLTTTT